MSKPHLEFFSLDMDEGWETLPGYPPGFAQKILASDIDEDAQTGSRSRLMRIQPGAQSDAPFVHDHWEEVFLLSGDLIVGADADGNGGNQFHAPTYACRPPGAPHGPFGSEIGCIMFEVHYYTHERGDQHAR